MSTYLVNIYVFYLHIIEIIKRCSSEYMNTYAVRVQNIHFIY